MPNSSMIYLFIFILYVNTRDFWIKVDVTNLLSAKVEKDTFYPFVSTKELLGIMFLIEFELKFLEMNGL